MVIDFANKIVNHIPITPQEVKKLLSMSFGSGWIKLHPSYLETIPKAEDLFAGIPPNTQMQQIKAVQSWMATNWTGVCEVLTKISNPTLVITGTDDIIVPTANSLIIAGKIPGAGLYRSKMLVINYQSNIQINSIEYYNFFIDHNKKSCLTERSW